MGKLAFVFSTIGCGRVGVGRDLYDAYPEFRHTFDQVSELSGVDTAQVCFEGPEECLASFDRGLFAQLAMSLACYRVARAHGLTPDYLCGMCEGQIICWVAADALDVAGAVRVCRCTAEMLKQMPPGLMARIVGLDLSTVEDICRQANQHGVVDIAIILGAQAVSVSGEPRAVKAALTLARVAGAERAEPVRLEPKPAHSRLMQPGVRTLLDGLADLKFRPPRFPILSALDGQPQHRAEALLPAYAHEVGATSNWLKVVHWLTAHDVDTFLSLGITRGELILTTGVRATSLHLRDAATLAETLAFFSNVRRVPADVQTVEGQLT